MTPNNSNSSPGRMVGIARFRVILWLRSRLGAGFGSSEPVLGPKSRKNHVKPKRSGIDQNWAPETQNVLKLNPVGLKSWELELVRNPARRFKMIRNQSLEAQNDWLEIERWAHNNIIKSKNWKCQTYEIQQKPLKIHIHILGFQKI